MEEFKTIEKPIELKFAHFSPETWDALGKTLRTGWVKRGVSQPENVAEHTMSMLKIVNALGDISETERTDLLEMIEIHDWPEAIEGDQVTAVKDIDEKKRLKEEKFIKEKTAMSLICAKIEQVGDRIMNLWLRFEKQEDAVAVLAKQIDKYQAVEKALEYERSQNLPLFREFFDYVRDEITHPTIVAMMSKLESEWKSLKSF